MSDTLCAQPAEQVPREAGAKPVVLGRARVLPDPPVQHLRPTVLVCVPPQHMACLEKAVSSDGCCFPAEQVAGPLRSIYLLLDLLCWLKWKQRQAEYQLELSSSAKEDGGKVRGVEGGKGKGKEERRERRKGGMKEE